MILVKLSKKNFIFAHHYFARFHKIKPFLDFKDVNMEKLKKNAEERRVFINFDKIFELERKRITMTRELNEMNCERKRASAIIEDTSGSSVGIAIDKNTITSHKIDRRELRDRIKQLQADLKEIESELSNEAINIPNWSSPLAPLKDNSIIYEHKSVKEEEPQRQDHVDICKLLGLVDFEGPALTSGAHFYALKDSIALLELALISWSVKKAVERGFRPISAPDVIKEKFVFGSGFQPRKNNKNSLPIYTLREPTGGQTEEEEEGTTIGNAVNYNNNNSNANDHSDDTLALAGTSEIFLLAQHCNQIIDWKDLPIKYVAWSHCFRSEVGHHTAASRGLYRVHQFSKVELFALTRPEDSPKIFEEIVELQGQLLKDLNLDYRVLEMSTWELGSSAHRKWDHEVWMAGRKIWGEVMSTSNCTDYQSKRLSIRARINHDPIGKALIFPHTLNGTACAIPRIIMALLEKGWNPGRPTELTLPVALKPYLLTFPEEQAKLTIKYI